MVEFPVVWTARLLAVVVFLACFVVVFWFALVHTVHLGTLSVPDLRAKTLEEAEQVAHDIGLIVEVEEPGVFSSSVAPEAVAAQEPHPGFHVKTGSSVKVRLSLGNKRTEIPDLTDESQQSALRALERTGLRPGARARVMYQSSGDRVIATDPPIGSSIPPSQEVNLLVNVAPEQELWVMPNLLSQPVQQVRRFCRNNYLRLGQVHEVTYPGMPAGIVLRQYPAAGSPLSRSDIITVWITQ
jgi:beta-lactam-binding protein with PASTA domain